MKHAINELKALLDTWGPQKDGSWKDHMSKAISVLDDLTEDKAELNLEFRVRSGNLDHQWSSKLDLKGKDVSDAKIAVCDFIDKNWSAFEDKQHHSDMTALNVEEKANPELVTEWHDSPPRFASEEELKEHAKAHPYNPNYGPVDEAASLEISLKRELLERCGDGIVEIPPIEDDLGTLDPSAKQQCGLDECESCQ